MIGDLLPRLEYTAVPAYKEAGIHVADDNILRVLPVKAPALAKVDALAGVPGHCGLEERQGNLVYRKLHIRYIEEAALCLCVNAEFTLCPLAHALDPLDIRKFHLMLGAYNHTVGEANPLLAQRFAELRVEAEQIIREFRSQLARGKGYEERLGLANVMDVVTGDGIELQFRKSHIPHIQTAKSNFVAGILAAVVRQIQRSDFRELHIRINLAV